MVRTMVGVLLVGALTGGCAGKARELMPTPLLYQSPGQPPGQSPGQPSMQQVLFTRAPRDPHDLELLYVTDRAGGDTDAAVPYGEGRLRGLVYGSARVRIGPGLDGDGVLRQSLLARRTRPVTLELGRVEELGRFPEEPYAIVRDAADRVRLDPAGLRRFARARADLQQQLRVRLAATPRKELLLYVHGFNETFASAAYTAAELCHFLGREPVCAIFTWPAAASGNLLTSYTATTESAEYAVEHLKKTLRMLAATPGLERIQLLAHSRGTLVLVDALRELVVEALIQGQDPRARYRIDNLVLMSPDIDIDLAAQKITGFVSDPDLLGARAARPLPRLLSGRLTVYASPRDRALLISRILFRSRDRVGQIALEDIRPGAQRYLATLGRIDLVSYEGRRTDFFGHGYFTTNPRVSADLVALLRYGRGPDDPLRALERTGPATWRFPDAEDGVSLR
ncbi:alpha/beta hydrolase [Marichromatium sp. AB31]|uniref:alpha/beta hydrolase n=1 Tax=Marichromatium sp. AB31 TaxID=2483362 RepID=UPI003515FA56